jgi:hypothetical protein
MGRRKEVSQKTLFTQGTIYNVWSKIYRLWCFNAGTGVCCHVCTQFDISRWKIFAILDFCHLYV